MSSLVGADPCGKHSVGYSLLSILPAGNSSRRPEPARVRKNEDKQFLFFHKAIQVLGKQVELGEKADDK